MSEQKTHAEIIAEMNYGPIPEHRHDREILRYYAYELDASHKREIEDAERRGHHAATKAICETIEKVGPLYDAESVGNAVKMREALLGARTMAVGSVNCGGGEPWNRLVDIIDEALAAPTRNCDLYADEQSAWEAFSEKRQGPDSSTEEYEQWLFEKATA